MVGIWIAESGCGEQLRDFFDEPLAGTSIFEGALPDGDDVPALVEDGGFVAEIAGLIPFDFHGPEIDAGFRKAEGGAILMPVPEAAVNEDNGAVFREDNVGFSGQCFIFRAVDCETVAEPVEHRSKSQLWLGVPPANAGHDFRALFRREDIHGDGH